MKTINIVADVKEEHVSTEVLCKICDVLNCQLEDIMDMEKESQIKDI